MTPRILTQLVCSSLLNISSVQFCYSLTTIIIIGTGDTIVVAADSKVASKNPLQGSMCKIRELDNNLFGACVGYVAGPADDVIQTIERIGKTALGQPRMKIDLITDTISMDFTRSIHLGTPDSNEVTHNILDIFFFTISADTPTAYLRRFISVKEPGRYFPRVEVDSIPIVFEPNRITYRISWWNGGGLVLDDNLIYGPEFRGQSLIDKARILMSKAVAIDTTHSRPPIDILCIDKTGYHWIQKKQECK